MSTGARSNAIDKSITTEESKVVAIASIAAELQSVMRVAWGLSLAAKNAMVMSAQAGEKALGFQPITTFIDDIAKETIDGVNDINKEAIKLSRITVAEERASDANQRFLSVFKKNKDAAHIDSLTQGMSHVENNLQVIQSEFNKRLHNLVDSLDKMSECMLSARSIASVSRVVTADAQEYSDKLKAVADSLDEAAIHITDKVNESYKHLQHIK